MTLLETKERPILFSGEMVRAILAGRKSQTRRVVKPQPSVYQGYETDRECINDSDCGIDWKNHEGLSPEDLAKLCPYGQPGDRLWVRETFFIGPPDAPSHWRGDIYYAADGDKKPSVFAVPGEILICEGARWKPSIHMPRWASRITLEITNVRVERVQEISEGDCFAEGIWVGRDLPDPSDDISTAREAFMRLWDSINYERGFGWDKNPWCWILNFRRIE